jgi:cytochrome c oxidase subunit 2
VHQKVRGTRTRAWLIAAIVGLGLVLGGCAENAPQTTLKPEGKWANRIDELWRWPYWISVVVFFIVEGLILYAFWRFRRRGDHDAPKQIHGNFKLEVGLTALPLIILLGLAVPTVGTLLDLAKKPTGNEVTIEVIGHQWWWEYRYDNGVRTANELVFPVGTDIELELHSADVIHSYWIPKLNGKRDVIPGRLQLLKIRTEKEGYFFGQCVEFCGDSHAYMRNRARAVSKADFAKWLDDQQQAAPVPSDDTSPAGIGHGLFTTKGCSGCHTIKGVSQGRIGPDLTHLQSRDTFAGSIFKMNEVNLAAWLRDPPGEKPGSKMPNLKLSEDEIHNLVAYLETLK